MCTLVNELSNCYGYFLRISGYIDLFGKVFLINFESFDQFQFFARATETKQFKGTLMQI